MKNEYFRHKFVLSEEFREQAVLNSKLLRVEGIGEILFDKAKKTFGEDCYNFLQEKNEGARFEFLMQYETFEYVVFAGWQLPPKQYTYAVLRWSEVLNGTSCIHI
jgi:hypothetical protein